MPVRAVVDDGSSLSLSLRRKPPHAVSVPPSVFSFAFNPRPHPRDTSSHDPNCSSASRTSLEEEHPAMLPCAGAPTDCLMLTIGSCSPQEPAMLPNCGTSPSLSAGTKPFLLFRSSLYRNELFAPRMGSSADTPTSVLYDWESSRRKAGRQQADHPLQASGPSRERLSARGRLHVGGGR
jgi:hypothetical protein